jgi:cysteine-rich repeat protein
VPGHDSLVTAKSEPPGANCAAGGLKVEIGLDLDSDGVLDPNEIKSTAFVCNGVSTTSADAGLGCTVPADCPASANECAMPICTHGLCDFASVAVGTTCHEQAGFVCNGNGACVAPGCGDGIITAGEFCDDGNFVNGDGCSGCALDTGFFCTGFPSLCRLTEFSTLGQTFHYSFGVGGPANLTPLQSGTGQMVGAPISPSTGARDLCDAPQVPFTGFIVLAERGTCTFYKKAINAALGGATSIIVYNNVAGAFLAGVAPPDPMVDPPITIPLEAISGEDGNFLAAAVGMQTVIVTWLPFMAP